MTNHTQTPWRDPGEHGMTGYGDINHVILGDDGKIVGALYANCFDAPGMNELPTVEQAAANAALILKAVNNHDALVALAKSYEQWEADFIMENRCWTGQNATLTDELYDRMIALQGERNRVLGAVSTSGEPK